MKLQLKTLTWSDFDQHKPCYSPRKRYGGFSGTILDILKDERIPNVDKIWAFTRKGIMDDKTLRLFAVRCARQVQHLMKDERSVNALDVAERYANGMATSEELEAAHEEALEAWAAAAVAGAATGATAVGAARAASREAAWEAGAATAWAAEEVAAEEVARKAAGEAREAGKAECGAVWAAALAATRAAQIQIAIDLINEFYEVPEPIKE